MSIYHWVRNHIALVMIGLCAGTVVGGLIFSRESGIHVQPSIGMRAEQVSVQDSIGKDLTGSVVTGVVTFERIGWIKTISVYLYDKRKNLLGWETLDFLEPQDYNPPEHANDKWPIGKQFFVAASNSFFARIPVSYANSEKVSNVKYEIDWWVEPIVATTQAEPASITPIAPQRTTQRKIIPPASFSLVRQPRKPIIEPPQTISQSIVPALLCYYPFDGNAQDESGNELHGNIYGATLTIDRFGILDSAFHFNGKNSYIEIPKSAHLNPVNGLTVSTWVRLTKPLKQNENVVVSKFLSGRKRCYSLYIGRNRVPVAYIAGKRMGGKTAHIQKVAPSDWFDANGITTKGKKSIVLYKKVSKDFQTQEGTHNETDWKIGTIVTHPDWNPKGQECGPGKFHACSRPFFADPFRNKMGDTYIAISVAIKDTYAWPNPSYSHKIAFRACKVLHECDAYGEKK